MKALIKGFGIILALGILLVGVNAATRASAQTGTGTQEITQVGTPIAVNPYYTRVLGVTSDGMEIEADIINGPPIPPEGYSVQNQAVALPAPDVANGVNTLTVPPYTWEYGCSSVSGSMIAAYYDRNGYPNMYTGSTNGGLMPLVYDPKDWPWSAWTETVGGQLYTYLNNPLIASHNGLDGRTTRGSIDDYWYAINSDNDPYISGGWTPHTWGDAIGDYMYTSQSVKGNVDGSTRFLNYRSSTRLTCAEMESSTYGGFLIKDIDGTYGRKQFYQARGYTVTDCYNQPTDNQYSGGFSFSQFMTEINSGHPVMLNLEGHTIVGIGYDNSTNTVYINDTWDFSNHTMTWGGSYDGMALFSVSIVNLAPTQPGPFTKSSPTNGAINQSLSPTLSWDASSGATSYTYCIDTTNNLACDTSWTSASGTNVALNGLSRGTTYYWQVRASNSNGTTYANGSSTAYWSFTTIPNHAPATPSSPIPANSAISISAAGTVLVWTGSDPDGDTLKYDVYLDEWASNPSTIIASDLTTNNFAPVLYTGTTYYWKVVAKDAYGGSTSGPVWSFTTDGTLEAPVAFSKSAPATGATGVSVNATLSWADSLHASSYELSCYLQGTTTLCPGLTSDWQSLDHLTSYTINGLGYLTSYTWQVRGVNANGTVYADGLDSAYTTFTTQNKAPAAFAKIAPVNGITGQPTSLILSWQATSPVTIYEYCIDTTNDGVCASWQSAGTATSAAVNGLRNSTSYYWQVRARNIDSELIYADSGAWWLLQIKPYYINLPLIRR